MPLAVLASDCTPQEKLLVLALYHHDWDGEKAWPTLERLSKITGFAPRTIQKARAGLQERGWMKTEERPGRSTIYSLDVPDMSLDEFNALLGPRKKDTGSKADPRTTDMGTHAPGTPHPGTTDAPLNNRAKNENQDNVRQQADDASVSKLIAIYCQEYRTLKGSPYKLSGKDAGQAKLAAKANPDFEAWFRGAAQTYLKDAWGAQTGFTLSAMLSQLNKWATKAAGGQKGACLHTDSTIVERHGTAEAHKCKFCGVITWK